MNWDLSTAIHSAETIERLYSGSLTPNLVNPGSDTQVLVDGHNCFFPGTASRQDIVTDVRVAKEDWVEHTRVHAGFLAAFRSIANALQMALAGADQIVFHGHSLGGALALLAAFWFEKMDPGRVAGVYTFGQPRVGNGRFARAYHARLGEKTWRFVNQDDVIPRVPWMFGTYRHAGHEIYLTRDRRVIEDRSPFMKMLAIPDTLGSTKAENQFISASAHGIATYGQRLRALQ